MTHLVTVRLLIVGDLQGRIFNLIHLLQCNSFHSHVVSRQCFLKCLVNDAHKYRLGGCSR